MKVIRNNIVGLFRFIALLFSVFILPSRRIGWEEVGHSLETPDEYEKYKALVGGPSEPLVPTETVFCPKCHVAVTQVRHTVQGTEIIQHGKVLVTVGGNVTITKNGQEMKGLPMRCPNGHIVRIE